MSKTHKFYSVNTTNYFQHSLLDLHYPPNKRKESSTAHLQFHTLSIKTPITLELCVLQKYFLNELGVLSTYLCQKVQNNSFHRQ